MLKTWVRTGLVLLFLCSVPVLPSLAAGRGECLTARSAILGGPVAYCALLPPSYDQDRARRYPVLYYLHGLGDNEQMFLRSGGWSMVQQLWDEGLLGEFIIVTPRGGASFYLNSRDGQYLYSDFLLQEFLPYIENRYRIRPGRASRGIAGISMGGYGALRLAFSRPDLFGSVATHSAALVPEMPNISAGTSARGAMRFFAEVFGSPVDRAFWDRNNPLALARAARLAALKIYFDCGAQDEYGFETGAQALHNVLTSRRVAHEFHIYPGGHDWEYFAEYLPASLGFHSRAFGLTQPAR
jgi:S-formylglutathione hydrolase FrmB